jgi:hypothetical protein
MAAKQLWKNTNGPPKQKTWRKFMNPIFSSFFLFFLLAKITMSLTLENQSNEIIVSNDYYRAVIAQKTGMVESLKMHGNDFELISDYTSYSLFFVEYMYEHPNGHDYHFDCPADWDAPVTVSVIHHDSQSAFIKVLYEPGYINSEWYYLFEEDQPWFSATITRYVETEGVYSNFQQCTMYNSDVDNSFIINYKGEIELTMGNYDGNYPWVSPYLDGVSYSTRTAQHNLWTQFDYGEGRFYPTIAWSDNESGICMGAVVTWTSPNQRTTISYHGGGSTMQHPGFAEAQWNWFGKSDSEALFLKRGLTFSMNLIFYQNISHIDSLFSFIESLKSPDSEIIESVDYKVASWAGRSSPLAHYFWRFPQVSSNFINSQELWRHKGFSVPRSQIGTHDSQLFSFDMFHTSNDGTKTCVSPIYGTSPLFTDIENIETDSSMSGIMRWNENSISSQLAYTAFLNRNDIKVEGSIEKQSDGTYSIELSHSPRVSGVKFHKEEAILTIYSLDALLDTVAIALLLESGIDSLDFTDSKKTRLFLDENVQTPSFSIAMAGTHGMAIASQDEFYAASESKATFYEENFLQPNSYPLAFQGSANYLAQANDTDRFIVYAARTFDEFLFSFRDNFQSARIQTGTTVTNVALIKNANDSYAIQFPFVKDQVYTISLHKETAVSPPPYAITLMKIYPSPAINCIQIEFFAFHSQTVQIKIFNIIGQQYYSRSLMSIPGVNNIPINLQKLPSGAYFLQIEDGHNSFNRPLTLLK